MKAVVCRAFGPLTDLTLETIETPAVEPGKVVINVHACGLNFYDGLTVEGKYQTKPPFPFSPGGEVAGVIAALGEDVDGFAVGQRVLAFTGFGGFAEQVAADATRVVPIDDSMDYAVAAGFLIAYATSYHALKDRAAIRPGETLLVLGAAGGVGLAAVELGKALGARVIAAASSEEKLALCRAHGADETINYAEDDLREQVKALTGGKGADVIYDPVGGKLGETAVKCLATLGRLLVIGFASGDIPQLAFNQLLLKQVSVMGVLWGAWAKANPALDAANLNELLALHAKGRIRPHISETYPMDDYLTALSRVMERHAKGKVVLLTGASS
jgi:NADPH2:quinone reductase